jgi:DNA polymerase-1
LELDSTNSDILEKLDDEVAKEIIIYRQLGKLAGSYGINFLEYINPNTGRIHCSFNQQGTNSGRYSTSKPSIQNIPVREHPEYRTCFVEVGDYTQVTADYSQFEMRLAGEFSNDQVIIDAFLNDKDLHALSAAAMYNVPFEEVTKAQRSNGKTFNFSVLYGAEAYTVSTRLQIPIDEAEVLVRNWRAGFPGLANYLDSTATFLKNNGYVLTPLGRRRYFNLPSPRTPGYRGIINRYVREGCNHPIQGANADAIKIALCNIHYRLWGYDAKLIRTVHDEISVRCKEELAEGVVKIVHDEMVKAAQVYLKRIPVKVDPVISKSWDH